MTDTDVRLTFKWVDGVKGLERMADAWAALARRTGADIYATPVWVLTWWAHFGRGKTLRTLVAYDTQGQLVALLPFMIYPVWLGPVRIRIAKLAATDPNTVIFQLAATETALKNSCTEALNGLLGDGRAHLVSFTPASEHGTMLAAIRDGVAPELALTDTPAGTHTVFELPDTFEGYLANLSKKRRGQYRRDLKHLQNDHGLTTRMVHPDAHQFGDFVDFHNRQWQEVGKGGHFADWPGSAASTAIWQMPPCRGRKSGLSNSRAGTAPLPLNSVWSRDRPAIGDCPPDRPIRNWNASALAKSAWFR